jgi:hypothetical protein
MKDKITNYNIQNTNKWQIQKMNPCSILVLRSIAVGGNKDALPGAKLLKKFDQNVLLPFGRLVLLPGIDK